MENLVGGRRSLRGRANVMTCSGAFDSRLGIRPLQAGRKNLGALLILLMLPTPGRSQAPTLTNKWSVPLGGRSDSSPAIGADGTIYFGTWEGNLLALRPNGARKWTFRAGREIRSSPALGTDGTVYFGCRDRKFYAVGADGQEKWEFKTGAWVDSSPVIGSDGTLYFGSWDNSFYALDSSGARKWVFQTGGPVVSSPAIGADARIYFGSHNRKFYALKPDGTKAWEYVTGGAIISSPAIDKDGTIYITSVDGFLLALNPDGILKWRLKTGGITECSPIIGQEDVIYIAANDRLLAISAQGVEKWTQEVESGYGFPIDSTPSLLSEEGLCISTSSGLLTAWDRKRTAKWVFYFQTQSHSSPAVDRNGTIYIAGHVFGVAFRFYALPAGTALAKSPWPKFRGNLRNTGNVADVER